MIIIDSCGWLEWFTDGELADQYKGYIAAPENTLMPVIILYEVYKILKREVGEEKALIAVGYMQRSSIIPLDDTLALAAADIAQMKNWPWQMLLLWRPHEPTIAKSLLQMQISKIRLMWSTSRKKLLFLNQKVKSKHLTTQPQQSNHCELKQ